LGRLARGSFLCLAGVAGLLFQSGSASAQQTVRSRDGQITAKFGERSPWCGPVVSLTLEAPDSMLKSQTDVVHRFIGGVRAVVSGECPAAEVIRVEARQGSRLVYRAYTAGSDRWSIFELPGLPLSPDRAKAFPEDAIFRRMVATGRARQINHFAGIQGAAFQAATTATDDSVQWRVENVSLKLSLVSRDNGSVAEQANAVAFATANACIEQGGTPDAALVEEKTGELIVSVRGFDCRKQADSYAQSFIIHEEGALLHVLSIYSTLDADRGENLRAVRTAVLAAVTQLR
jgi:hypothetical protein